MKKNLSLVIIVLIVLLTSCAGSNDWRYDLPGNYSVWRFNSRSIKLCKDIDETSADTIIGPYVSEISYNENYIFAKKVSVPEDLNKKIDTSNPEYYILEVENDKLYGPYSAEEFDNKCNSLGINDLPKWTKTIYLNSK